MFLVEDKYTYINSCKFTYFLCVPFWWFKNVYGHTRQDGCILLYPQTTNHIKSHDLSTNLPLHSVPASSLLPTWSQRVNVVPFARGILNRLNWVLELRKKGQISLITKFAFCSTLQIIFGIINSWKRISQNSFPNFIYIFPKSFMIFYKIPKEIMKTRFGPRLPRMSSWKKKLTSHPGFELGPQHQDQVFCHWTIKARYQRSPQINISST